MTKRHRPRRSVLYMPGVNARALGDRCDQVSGRLENATQLQRCVTLGTCKKVAACLQQAFVFKPPRKTP